MASSKSSGAAALMEHHRAASWRVSSSAMRAASSATPDVRLTREDQFMDPNDMEEIEDEHDEGGDDDSVIMQYESPQRAFLRADWNEYAVLEWF